MFIVAYVLNRSPTKRLILGAPEEAWSGTKPSASHLRIFGSLCCRHVFQMRRGGNWMIKVILVRYHPTGAYKLYSPTLKKIVFSRDVVIDESASWNWKEDLGRTYSGAFLFPSEDQQTDSGGNVGDPV